MGLIHGHYPPLATLAVDDHHHMKGSVPVDQQQQLLQHVRIKRGLFNDFC